MPLLWAGIVHLNAAEYSVADSFLSIAQLLRNRLTPFERANIDYITAQLRGNAELAYRMALEMKESDPTSAAYTAGLAAWRINRLFDAIEHFNDIDMNLPWIRQWGGSWSVPSHAYHMLGDYEAEYELAQEGIAEHPDSRLLRDIEIRALIGMGRTNEALDRIDALTNLRSQGNMGLYFRNAALEFRAHGQPDAAERMFERTIDWYRGISPEELDQRRASYAISLMAAGRWEEARAEYQVLLEREPDNPDRLGPFGVIAVAQGDRERAFEISSQLADMDRPYLFGQNTLWRARIAAMSGQREDAVRLLRQAFTERLNYGIWPHRDIYLESLRGYGPYDELMRSRE